MKVLHYCIYFFDRLHTIIFLLLDRLKLQIFTQLLPQKIFLSLILTACDVFWDEFVFDLKITGDRHIKLVSHDISLLSMN